MAEPLYDSDFLEWTEQQARLLRQGPRAGNPLDYDHLAEEIADLGKRDLREFENRLAVIVSHLIKLHRSPADEPRRHRLKEIAEQRRQAKRVLQDSPSLRGRVRLDHVLRDGWARACDSLRYDDRLAEEDLPPRPAYTLDDLLEGELPEAEPDPR